MLSLPAAVDLRPGSRHQRATWIDPIRGMLSTSEVQVQTTPLPKPPRFVSDLDGDLYQPSGQTPLARSPTSAQTPWFAPTPRSPVPAMDQTFVNRPGYVPQAAQARDGRDTLFSAPWFGPQAPPANAPSILLLVASGVAGGLVATAFASCAAIAVAIWLWWA
jgi:hypothetical protein